MHQLATSDAESHVVSVNIVASGAGDLRVVHLLHEGDSVMVGSDDQCGLQLPDPTVSPKQCLIQLQQGELLLHDWCAREGTRVNGQPVEGEALVSPEDRIEFGNVALTFEGVVLPSDDDVQARDDSVLSHERQDEIPTDNQVTRTPAALELPVPVERPVAREETDVVGVVEPRKSVEESTIDLLQTELQLLEAQLSEKDALIAELSQQGESNDRDCDSNDFASQRVQRLLVELDQSEQRIAALEELSQHTEEVRLAEQEEKRQLDAWVGDIERRLVQREEEIQAECDVLRERLQQATQDREDVEGRVDTLLENRGDDQGLKEMIQVLQRDNESLRARVDSATNQCRELEKECNELRQQNTEEAVEQRIVDAVRTERLELAQERAELSRQKRELSRNLSQASQQMEKQAAVHPADDKFRVFREQLRELHAQEKAEYVPPSLGQRLVQLWQRLDGPTDKD